MSLKTNYQRYTAKIRALGIRRYLLDLAWGSIENIVLFVSVFLTTLVVARYLGPDNLGLLGYLQSFVGLLLPLALLGADRVVVKHLVSDSEHRDEILASAMFLRVASAVLSYVILFGFLLFSKEFNNGLFLAAAIGGGSLLLSPLNLLGQEFVAKTQLYLTARFQVAITVLLAATKVLAAWSGASLSFFFLVILFEGLLRVGCLVFVHRRVYPTINFSKARLSRAIKILRESWLLLATTFAVAIYMKIDQLMLVEIAGKAAGGIYVPAVRIIGMSAIFPTLAARVALPPIIRAIKENVPEKIQDLRRLICVFFAAGLAASLGVIFAVSPLVIHLFGSDFADSAKVLNVLAWSLIAIFGGTAIHSILFAADMTRVMLFGAILGAVTNIILNFILIPKYGVLGAATATVISNPLSVFATVISTQRARKLIFSSSFLFLR